MTESKRNSTVYISFLPSDFGTGFECTVREDLGATEKGWKDNYSHLKGYAKEFYPEVHTWGYVVKKRLQEQGKNPKQERLRTVLKKGSGRG